MDIIYSVVNSFATNDIETNTLVGGNSAGVILIQPDQSLSDSIQLEIAKLFPELTEIVFVYPCDSDKADFGMRYWSPQRLCEYEITGHPTVAAGYSMLINEHLSIDDKREEYTLETKAGNVPLQFDYESNKIFMGQIKPVFQDIPEELEPEILAMFGLKNDDAVTPVKAVNMGLGYFIFKVRDLETLMRMDRNLPKLEKANRKFGLNGGAQPFADVNDSTYELRTRNLDLRPLNSDGVWLEDTACGQGSASVMAYLMQYCEHSGELVRMQQGVPSEPCCVEASGKIQGGLPTIFIGGTAFERECGVVKNVEKMPERLVTNRY